ncbi:exo-alpha-sialidase [Roseovarius sp. LXJ103]|uniref:exo-alpha-sialidase n=1 Tax=Roseovarius carneus TaxID=2853164 RepID=UPI000D6054C6|nr:exo-alpha-sialidase [Roseovarius carneus]MBZ8118667.1 exo-alpha-sialidase [Roseovarius carneus]PWE35650.1 hypothetical protein DD563_06570 [Pelagicola sp. LXJ1103]
MGFVQVFILAAMAVSVGLSAWAIRRDAPLEWRFAPATFVDLDRTAEFVTVLDYTAPTGQAHSPAIDLSGPSPRVLWFEGSEEAKADVDIFASDLTEGDVWRASAPKRVLARGGLTETFAPTELVVTLGNTIEDEGRGGLYATVVSVGGWAMASVAEVRDGAARKLNLSPLLNRSFLVKSPMVAYEGGAWGLPAYFEMGGAYGALVRFAPDGRVRDMRRMPGAQKGIQPMIVPLDATRAVAILRDFDSAAGRLLISRTQDGGQSWSEMVDAGVANPSAPVAALPLGDGRIVMAVNDDAGNGGVLRLTLSHDGGESWEVLHTLEDGREDARYPMMRALGDGRIMLTYSVGAKGGIRAHVFSAAWAVGS